MFWKSRLKTEVEAMKHCLDQLRQKIGAQESVAVVICEICGCYVRHGRAIKGKSEIRERDGGIYATEPPEEYIHTPYYCGRCAPKGEPISGKPEPQKPNTVTITFWAEDAEKMKKQIVAKAREIAETACARTTRKGKK